MRWNDPLVVVAMVTGVLVVAVLAAGLLVPQLPTLKQLLVGVKVPPTVVAACRLTISALGATLLTLLTDYLTSWNGTRMAAVGVALTSLVTIGWGFIDQWQKGRQNQVNPPPVAGGGSSDLLSDR